MRMLKLNKNHIKCLICVMNFLVIIPSTFSQYLIYNNNLLTYPLIHVSCIAFFKYLPYIYCCTSYNILSNVIKILINCSKTVDGLLSSRGKITCHNVANYLTKISVYFNYVIDFFKEETIMTVTECPIFLLWPWQSGQSSSYCRHWYHKPLAGVDSNSEMGISIHVHILLMVYLGVMMTVVNAPLW